MLTHSSSGMPLIAFCTALSIRAVMENWAFAVRIAVTTEWL